MDRHVGEPEWRSRQEPEEAKKQRENLDKQSRHTFVTPVTAEA